MAARLKHCHHQLAALVAAAMLVPLHAAAMTDGLRPMGEAELGKVSARGLPDESLHHAIDGAQADTSKVIGKLTASLDKGLNFLDVETTLRDVSYDPARATTFANADGSITQILPNTIGEVSFENIRVKGAAPGASFGSISIKAIDLAGTSLILSPRR